MVITTSAPRAASAALRTDCTPADAIACTGTGIDVIADDAMAGLHQVGRHRRAHVAETDEADRRHRTAPRRYGVSNRIRRLAASTDQRSIVAGPKVRRINNARRLSAAIQRSRQSRFRREAARSSRSADQAAYRGRPLSRRADRARATWPARAVPHLWQRQDRTRQGPGDQRQPVPAVQPDQGADQFSGMDTGRGRQAVLHGQDRRSPAGVRARAARPTSRCIR